MSAPSSSVRPAMATVLAATVLASLAIAAAQLAGCSAPQRQGITAMPAPASTAIAASVTRAQHQDAPRAALATMTPLLYAAGADVASDRPAHVRATSAVRRFAGGLIMAQDDANFLALRAADGTITALPLPPDSKGKRLFSEALGNKAEKMDLEAALVLPDGRLVAFGSGSKPARKRLVVVTPSLDSRVVDAAALYDALDARKDFVGAEMNIEGAVHINGTLRLFQRGNAAVVEGRAGLDATIDIKLDAFVAWLDGKGALPALGATRRYDLGALGGVRLTFTDAVALPDGRVAFLAAAEASPDTYRDGAVTGCRVGIIDGDAVVTYDLTHNDDGMCHLKLEGIELLDASPAGLRFYVVADVDDTEAPALGGELFLPLP